ncbi:unnamed protein product [Orchesella dallaii]|uniref:KEN domain-containing protein n=1 Tax=Orchesella dallaii TaxID=48710 RepID=A0ABP1RAV9_9HEXA
MTEENGRTHPLGDNLGEAAFVGNMTSPIPLEAILSYPLFWTSSTLLNFVRDAHNCIKDDSNEAFVQLRESMDADLEAVKVIKKDWVEVLDESHWKILKQEGSKAKTQKGRLKSVRQTKSGPYVIQLIRLIRNKSEHFGDFGEDEKNTLGWFTNGQFDQHKFVVYWIEMFPRLLPFMWINFHKFKDADLKLKEYYLSHSSHEKNLRMNLSLGSLVTELIRTLNVHKENGCLLKRYTCEITRPGYNKSQLTVEFRTLNPLIMSMMSWAHTLKIEINKLSICSTWIDHSSNDGSVTEEKTIFNFNKEDEVNDCDWSKPLTLLVGTNLDEKLVMKCLSCEEDEALPENVIFLTSNRNTIIVPDIPKLVRDICQQNPSINIQEWKFNFCELSPAKQIEVLERNVVFQNKNVVFQSLLPKSILEEVQVNPSLLNWVDGEFLHELLTDKTPSLFGDILVQDSEFYIVRRIVSRGSTITSKALRQKSADVFLVTNISLDLLRSLSKSEEVGVELPFNQSELTRRIFWAERESDLQEFWDNYIPPEPKQKKRNFHFLKFTGEDSFQWLGTRGSVKLLQEQKFLDKTTSPLLEDEFLSQIINQRTTLPVVIADKPGMGKSWLLKSLSEKLSQLENHFVILIPMNNFIKTLFHSKENLQKVLTKAAIIETISKFVATTTAETRLLQLWSEMDGSGSQIKCELMFDGLDEVTKHKQEAKEVLKILCQECPHFRLWITVRDQMLAELEQLLSILGNKIVPFEQTDQIRFLHNFWQKGLCVEEGSVEDEVLLKFAEQNTISLLQDDVNKSAFTNEIAGIPLQCRMVAEVYQDHVKQFLQNQRDNNNHNTASLFRNVSLTELYRKMIDKKLEEYLRRGNPNLDLTQGFVDFVRLGAKKVHWYLAIKLLFSECWADKFRLVLINGVKKQTINDIFEFGLVQKQEPLTFVHRTFAEYFIALFTFEIATSTIELDPWSQESYAKFVAETVLDVVSEPFAHDKDKASIIDTAIFKFPVICYFLNTMLENCSKFDNILINSVCQNCHDFQNDLKFECKKSVLLAAVRSDFLHIFKLLFKSLDCKEREELFEKNADYHEFILSVSVRCSSVPFFKYICSVLEDWYREFKNAEYKISKELLYTAIRKGRYKIVKFLVEDKGFGPGTWVELQNSDKDKFSLLHHCLKKSRTDKRSVLDEKMRIIGFLARLDSSILELRDVKGRTPLLLPIDASIMLKRKLVHYGADVNAVGDKYKNTGLHWHCFSMFKGAISPEVYHQMLERFTEENFLRINSISGGNTPLHCAVRTYFDELKHESLVLFKEKGADFNILDGNGNTVLHAAINRDCHPEFIKKLITLGACTKIKNGKGQDALALAESKNSELASLIRNYY